MFEVEGHVLSILAYELLVLIPNYFYSHDVILVLVRFIPQPDFPEQILLRICIGVMQIAPVGPRSLSEIDRLAIKGILGVKGSNAERKGVELRLSKVEVQNVFTSSGQLQV